MNADIQIQEEPTTADSQPVPRFAFVVDSDLAQVGGGNAFVLY